MSDKKLSEMLQQDHDCGDYGQGLEGYPEMARALEAENKALRDKLEAIKEMHLDKNMDEVERDINTYVLLGLDN